jgi:hypothetical protein
MVSRALLSLSLLTIAAAVPVEFGPPTLCVPLDIGDAKSLPFGSEAFQPDKDYNLDRLPADTIAILSESADAELHFETLRRAAIYLMSAGKTERKEQHRSGKIASALHVALRTRVLDVVSSPQSSKKAQALAWFDLGLFGLDMEIVGMPQVGRVWAYLDKAGTLVGDDPGLNLGLFAAGYSQRKEAWWRPHLARALGKPADLPARTQENLLRLTGRFLGVKDMATLLKDYGPDRRAKKR